MAVTFSAIPDNDAAFTLTPDVETPHVRLFVAYPNEPHQYNLASVDVEIPQDWLQKFRTAFRRRVTVIKPTPVAKRRRAGFFSFIKATRRVPRYNKKTKATVMVAVPLLMRVWAPTAEEIGAGADPDSIFVGFSGPALKGGGWATLAANTPVTVTISGGRTSYKNSPVAKVTGKKRGLWNTDAHWEGARKTARTPVPVAGNELVLEDTTQIAIGPYPFPKKAMSKQYAAYMASRNREGDAYGRLVVRNTTSNPIVTAVAGGDLRVWGPDPADPTRTVSEVKLEGGNAGVVLDRRIQLPPSEQGSGRATGKTKKASFKYVPGAEYCSEGAIPVHVGSLHNGPQKTYESMYVYRPDGDVLRTTTPLKLTGESAKDTLRLSARAVPEMPVDVSNATLELWLEGASADDRSHQPVLAASLGKYDVAAGAAVRLVMPGTGLLDYMAWVRAVRGDRLANWRNWVRDPYDPDTTVTIPKPSTTPRGFISSDFTYSAQTMFRFDPYARTVDPWEGNQLTGAGTLEIDAQDSVFQVVTGRNVTAVPVTYKYTPSKPMVTAIYLCQTGGAGQNYSHIKDFTGTLKVTRGHAVVTPSVIVSADTALVGAQKAAATFKVTKIDLDCANGARATVSVCDDALLPEIVGTGSNADRPARVAFQSAYVPPEGTADLTAFYHDQYPTRLKPNGSLAAFSGELACGQYTTLYLENTTSADYLARPASAPDARLLLGSGARMALGADGLYRVRRPVHLRKGAANQELRLTDSNATVQVDVTSDQTTVLEIKPVGRVLAYAGSLDADVLVNNGVLVLLGAETTRRRLEFAPGAAAQRDRVIRTRTNTAFRGRHTYHGPLVLGPNGALRIGGA